MINFTKRAIALLISITVLNISFANAAGTTGSLKTRIIDKDDSSLPIAGAVVELHPVLNPDMKLYFATDGNGELLIPSIKTGDYTLNITFLGYKPLKVTIMIDDVAMELPALTMESSSVALGEVVKEVKALRTSINGDTLSYNAASFKVSNDADVEGLITKMPGISIEGGTVTAQGENVKKIMVDGREFFGDDVTTALKSLPAEVVDRIEVYDNLSDDAKFSGIDDGTGAKAINIITKPNMRQGVFGKLYGGVGYEPNAYEKQIAQTDREVDTQSEKYMVGGNLNIFNKRSRITLLGLYNNINQQSFSFEDIAGVGNDEDNTSSLSSRQLPGISSVKAFGVNFSTQSKEKNKLKFQGSYFFNNTYTINENIVERWYDENADSSIDSDYKTIDRVTDNTNHRFNGKIDWNINERNSLMVRPTFSVQKSEQYIGTMGERFKNDGENFQTYGNWRTPENFGYTIGTSANYRLRLGESGSTITMGGGFTLNNWDSDSFRENYNSETYTIDEYYEGLATSADEVSLHRVADNKSQSLKLTGNVNYNQKLSDKITMSVGYNISSTSQESSQLTQDSDEGIYDYITNESLTNETTSVTTTHKAGPKLKYKTKKVNIVAGVDYQRTIIDNETIIMDELDEPRTIDNTFENIVYSLITQLNFNAENALRINLKSNTTNPSVKRLGDVYSVSNNYISKGNPNLEPSYSNRLMLRYTNSNLEKGRTLMMTAWVEHADNYLTSHVYLDPHSQGDDTGVVNIDGLNEEDIIQYSTWTTLDNYWNFYGRLSYGLPLDFIKSNLNLNAIVSHSLIPSIFGGDYIEDNGEISGGSENMTSSTSYRLYTVLGSNISDKIDFTLTWRVRYNEATNSSTTSETGLTKNQYWDQQASATMKFILTDRLTLNARLNYEQYVGITNEYDVKMTILNAYIGYRLFKSRRGEINVGVNDIFNENTAFNRSVGNSYTQNETNLVIGRFYSMQFVYNLRLFGKNASKDMKDYKVGGAKKPKEE